MNATEFPLQSYAQFSPTQFDAEGLGLPERQDWMLAPVSQTRDSGTLDRSNFRVMLDLLGDESDTVEVHRFGHWGPGWFEIILIDPADAKRIETAQEAMCALADYPVLSEEDHSGLEFEELCESWDNMSLSEKIELCAEARVSIFAARRELWTELPHPAGDRFRDRYSD
jgi:hypothetical protein